MSKILPNRCGAELWTKISGVLWDNEAANACRTVTGATLSASSGVRRCEFAHDGWGETVRQPPYLVKPAGQKPDCEPLPHLFGLQASSSASLDVWFVNPSRVIHRSRGVAYIDYTDI